MLVFLPHKKATHTMYVRPAADPRVKTGDVVNDWVDEKNEPITFTIEFRSGKAEVPDALGKYLIATEQASKTRLIIPDED